MPDTTAPTTVPRSDLLELTACIVAAHVGHATLDAEALPNLIHSVFQALSTAGTSTTPAGAARPEPAVPVRRSVFPDHIVCLEDGKSFKALRRHLQAEHGLTPDQYRERWGLPRDYPVVAAAYTEYRSALARSSGLGRSKGARGDTAAAVPDEE